MSAATPPTCCSPPASPSGIFLEPILRHSHITSPQQPLKMGSLFAQSDPAPALPFKAPTLLRPNTSPCHSRDHLVRKAPQAAPYYFASNAAASRMKGLPLPRTRGVSTRPFYSPQSSHSPQPGPTGLRRTVVRVTRGNDEVVFTRPYRVQMPKAVYTKWVPEGTAQPCSQRNPDLMMRSPCQCTSCRLGTLTKLAVKRGDVSVAAVVWGRVQ